MTTPPFHIIRVLRLRQREKRLRVLRQAEMYSVLDARTKVLPLPESERRGSQI